MQLSESSSRKHGRIRTDDVLTRVECINGCGFLISLQFLMDSYVISILRHKKQTNWFQSYLDLVYFKESKQKVTKEGKGKKYILINVINLTSLEKYFFVYIHINI